METFQLTTTDGINLHAEYRCGDGPRAGLVVAHGIGEHSGRYAELAETLAASGLAVLTYDHRGHGSSPGQRAFVRSWDEYDSDLALAVSEVRRRAPDLPLFLFGHSLGGAMVLHYLVRPYERPAGVIASAPALGTPGVSPVLLLLARIMSRLIPRFSMDTGLDDENLSRDPSVIETYRADPLVHGKGTARLATELTRAQNDIFAGIGVIDVPLLLAYGDADRIAPREPIERLLSASGSIDKRLEVFRGGYHELHLDLEREQVLALYADWIADRI